MLFYVIYEIDVPYGVNVTGYKPPYIKRWKLLEGDEWYSKTRCGAKWEKGKHRKWAGTLCSGQFRDFVEEQNLYVPVSDPEKYPLSPPICFKRHIGIDPSIYFNVESSVFVTPMLEDSDFITIGISKDSPQREDWGKIVKYIEQEYG